VLRRLNCALAVWTYLGVTSVTVSGKAEVGSAPCELEALALQKQASWEAVRLLGANTPVQVSTKSSGPGISGTLVFEPEGHSPLRRHVQGANCSEVIDALGFSFQMYLEGISERTADQASAGTPPSSGPTASETPNRPPVSNPTLEEVREAEARTPSTTSGFTQPPQVRLAVGPIADWSYSRDMALGLLLDARMRLWKEHWLGLSLAYAQTGFFSGQTERLQTDAVSLGVSWIEATRIGRSQFHVAAELGPRLSWLDVTSAEAGARGQYALLSGVLSLGLSAEISPRVALETSVGAAAQLVAGPRPLEIEHAPTFQPASLGGTARLGVSAFF
jgi:hypothetical protein